MSETLTMSRAPVIFELDDLPSMDDLLEQDNSAQYGRGTIVTGKVVEKRDGGVIVDIGFKAEGYVPKDEFSDWEGLGLGDEIRALLEEIEDDENMPILSVEKAILQEAWDKFTEAFDEGSVVKGTIKFRVKGGLMVDVGVDALNPVQVTAKNMEPERLKAEFGDRISFWGGINTQHTLPFGTAQEVAEETKRIISILGKGGGYVLNSVHNIQAEVPPENIIAMFETGANHRYQ